jgi:hypothetical protein
MIIIIFSLFLSYAKPILSYRKIKNLIGIFWQLNKINMEDGILRVFVRLILYQKIIGNLLCLKTC